MQIDSGTNSPKKVGRRHETPLLRRAEMDRQRWAVEALMGTSLNPEIRSALRIFYEEICAKMNGEI